MYSGRTYGAEELVNVVDAGLDFWLTLGPYGDLFERQLARFVGAGTPSSSTGFLREPYGGDEPDLAAARTTAAPWRRGRDAGGHLPDHACPHCPVRAGPGLRRRELGTYNVDPDLLGRRSARAPAR